MRFDELTENVTDTLRFTRQVPLLLGEPGIGKSSWTKALAEQLHTAVFIVSCNTLGDKADLTGGRLMPYQTEDGEEDYSQRFFPHADIADAIRYAAAHPDENPILFLDEINRTSTDITSGILSLSTERKIGNKQLPDNLWIIAAGNDKGNIISFDDASTSRFATFVLEPDATTFLTINPDTNIFVRNVLMQHPELIFCKTVRLAVENEDDDDDNNDAMVDLDEILDDNGTEIRQLTTPRTITAASNLLNNYTHEKLMAKLSNIRTVQDENISELQELLEGFLGKTQFTAYLLSEIANNINNVGVQNNTVSKPSCYDNLKAAPTIDVLNDMIAALTDEEKSKTLVYAIHEKADNTILINTLLTQMTDLTPEDTKMLLRLYGADDLDEGNKQVFINNPSSLSQKYSAILVAA